MKKAKEKNKKKYKRIRYDSKNKVLHRHEKERADGRYEYRYINKYTNKPQSIYASTLQKLREKIDYMDEYKTRGIDTDKKNISLDELYKIWKINRKDELAPSTFTNYTYMYEKHVMGKFGKNKVRDLIKSDIKSYYTEVLNNKIMTAGTLDTIQTVIHQVLDVAVDDGYIRYNPSSGALTRYKKTKQKKQKFKEKRKHKQKILTVEDELKFFNYLKSDENNMDNKRWYRIFKFMDETGVRTCELCALQKDSVTREIRDIYIDYDLVTYREEPEEGAKHGKTVYYLNDTKNLTSTRTIPIVEETQKLIDEELEWQKEAGIKCRARLYDADKEEVFDDFLFLNTKGSFLTESMLNKTLKSIVKKYNETHKDKLPNIHPHMFRKMFNTRMMDAKVPLEGRITLMGHASDEVNIKYYTEAGDEYKRESQKMYYNYMREKEKKYLTHL